MFNLFRKSASAKAPLEGINIDIRRIPGAVEVIDKVPRIQWAKVREAVKPHAEHPALARIWTEIAAQWLGILRDHFSAGYNLYEGEHMLLLSADDPGPSRRLLSTGDHAYRRLDKLLNRSEEERGHGKHVVLLLKTNEQYYDYISHYYAEREQPYGVSAGVFLRKGYRHTAINAVCRSSHRTLVHELAHNMVALRPVPLWLNEGLAQTMEDMVPGYRAPIINARQVRLHRRYWGWFGLKHFWDGTAFSNIGSRRLSYQLAEILFRNLLAHRQRSRRMTEFLAAAHFKDAGLAACQACLGCDLNTLVAEFLGPGPWHNPADDDGR